MICRALRDDPPRGVGAVEPRRRGWRRAAAIAAGVAVLIGLETVMWQQSKVLVQPSPEDQGALLDEIATIESATMGSAGGAPDSLVASVQSLALLDDGMSADGDDEGSVDDGALPEL